MQDQSDATPEVVSTPQDPTHVSHLPAGLVVDLFQAIGELVSDEHVTKLQARSFHDEVDQHLARKFAEAEVALSLRTMLAGLLLPSAHGVTPNGLEWATGYVRRELAHQEAE